MLRLLLATTAAFLFAAPAFAGPYFIEASGASNWYDMETANQYIDDKNEDVGVQAIEHLDGGGSWAMAIGRIYDRRLATSVAYERLYGSTASTSPELIWHLKAPANIVRFQLAYVIARLGPVIPFVQGGAGILWSNGYVEETNSYGQNTRHEYSGTSLDLEGLVGFEVRIGDSYGINVSGGYRLAKIPDAKWKGDSFGSSGTFDGPGFDYTGGIVRVGVRIGLGWDFGDASETRDTSEDQTGWM